MACPFHPAATITRRVVPVEIYVSGAVPPFRVVGAEMETCSQCGASYYDWIAVAKLPAQSIVKRQAPTYDYDC